MSIIQQKRLWAAGLLVVLPLVIAGCFRQASEPFVEAPIGPLASLTAQADVPASDAATPTVVPLVIITNTSPFNAPATAEDQPATETPIGESSSPQTAPTSTIPILQATNTRAIVTPVPPAGPVNFSTPTPFGGLIATPTPLDLLVTPTDAFASSSQCAYIIQPGDTLYQIAINNETTVEALRQANPQLSGDLIQPGDELNLPGCGQPVPTITPALAQPTTEAPVGQRTHVVRSGDTLFAIAREYGVTVQAIIDANNLTNPDRLDLGQELVIP